MKLNKEQDEAAKFLNGVASVIATAGSGKTLTMTHRIANLVKNHGVRPESVLGLTFSRNASAAMKEKLKLILGNMATRVNLSTIHSFCYSTLKQEGKVFEIITEDEQMKTIKKILKVHKIKSLSPGAIVQEIGLAKNNLITPEEFTILFAGDEAMQKMAYVYELYEKEKKKKMRLDLNDLLLETCQLFKESSIREKYQTMYPHILIDEFQDTNPAQMEIINLLAGKKKRKASLFVVGDDWQAVYGFAGSSVRNILNFRENYPESARFVLNLNYRSTPQILAICRRLVHYNLNKIDKDLRTENPEGEEVKFLEGGTEEDEAMQIVSEIKELGRKGYAHKDIAVLYRANAQSRAIEEILSKQKVPYHIENGMNFYQRLEVKILLEYLRFIHNPFSDEGDEALKVIINAPTRYIGKTFIGQLEEHAADHECHLYEALKRMRIDVPYIRRFVKDFITTMDPLIRDAPSIEPAEMIGILRESLSYDKYISDDEIPAPDDEKISNVNQLHLAATRYSSIRALLAYTDTFSSESSNDKNGVALMTIHKSKGLEFEVVFLAGLIEGMLPSRRGDLEEERRVAFVAASRAKRILYMSHSHYFSGRAVKRSRFLDEIQKE